MLYEVMKSEMFSCVAHNLQILGVLVLLVSSYSTQLVLHLSSLCRNVID